MKIIIYNLVTLLRESYLAGLDSYVQLLIINCISTPNVD